MPDRIGDNSVGAPQVTVTFSEEQVSIVNIALRLYASLAKTASDSDEDAYALEANMAESIAASVLGAVAHVK